MRIIAYLLSLTLLLSNYGLAQENIEERVYLHLSSQDLIAGETLYYSAYCVSDLTNRPSQLSKVLYIEIIGENGAIYQEKLALNNGRGKGQFFISSIIGTGRYQVLAYTRWMRNFKEYFHSALEIINPYEELEENSLKPESKPTLDFYTYNDNLVIDTQNTVSFKIGNANSNSMKFSGRLVNDSGDEVTQVHHDEFGFGSFKFVPHMENHYQVIIEDTLGTIYFFDMPFKSVLGTTINLNQTADNKVLEVVVESTNKNEDHGTLVVRSMNQQIVSKSISLNSTNLISIEPIWNKPILIEVFDLEQNLLAEQIYSQVTPIVVVENNSKYTAREQVDLSLDLPIGEYSVSIRKRIESYREVHSHAVASKWKSDFSNELLDPDMFLSYSSKGFTQPYLMSSSLTIKNRADSISLLPEYRDEFFEGVAYDSNESPISNALITLALPGDPFQLRSAWSTDDGSFIIPFNSSLVDIDGYLSINGLETNFSVEAKSPFLSKYPKFNYTINKLSPGQINEIIARSIRNQIVNAYFEVETIGPTKNNWLSQFAYTSTYNLDDFTRFNSIKETFTEYIVSASVRDNRMPKIKVHFTNVPESEKTDPLLLLDGLPISSNEILAIPAEYIEKISLLNNRVFFGAYCGDGVIAFESKINSLEDFDLTSKRNKVLIKKVSSINTFNAPIYPLEAKSNLPDQRDQLYWNPEYEVTGTDESIISFFTSDVLGDFEVVIEGFTSDGIPVSKIIKLEVVDYSK